MKRDSFVFYKSFYDAIALQPKRIQADIYNAVFDYALNGNEPKVNGAALSIFLLIKPQIDANNERYENGKKGGRPSKNNKTDGFKNNEENKTDGFEKSDKKKTKPKPNVNVNENVNENVNVNVNVNEKDFVSFCKDNLSCSEAAEKEKETQHTLSSKSDRIKALVETYFGDELKGSDLGPYVHLLRNFDEGLIETVFKGIKKSGGKYGDAVQQLMRHERNGKE